MIHFLAEHCGVGIAESVDGLLGVADEHVEVAARQTLVQQALEIIVLFGTGVLKLVNHEVGNRRADTFINKGRAALQHGADEFVGVTDEDGVGLVAKALQVNVNHA